MKRKNLRQEQELWPWDITEVSDTELAELIESMGYVKRPVCGECDGGMQWHRPDPAYPMAEIMGRTCPSCGGTGFGKAIGQ